MSVASAVDSWLKDNELTPYRTAEDVMFIEAPPAPEATTSDTALSFCSASFGF